MPQKKKPHNKIVPLFPEKSTPSRIKATQSTSGNISFSLKHLQCNHTKFSFQNRNPQYLVTLLERLRDLSSMTVQEIRSNRSKVLRCHPISWEKTTEICFGIRNEEQIVETPYQFSVSSNEHGRIHGFFIDDIFYIVWLDPEHKLYANK